MIQIELREKGERFCCRAQGHADYAQEGEDIVCAGISTILYALAGYIANSRMESSIRMEPGDVEITCSGNAQQVFLMAYIGLSQLAEKFPKNISISARFPDAIQIET